MDPASVTFGPGAARPVHWALEDVDNDGDLDLILQFNTQQTGIVCGDVAAAVSGQTFAGQTIKGTDSVKTVGCN